MKDQAAQEGNGGAIPAEQDQAWRDMVALGEELQGAQSGYGGDAQSTYGTGSEGRTAQSHHGEAHSGDGGPAFDPFPWGDLTTFRSVAEGLTDAIKARSSVENRVKRGGGAADAVQAQAMIKAARDLEGTFRDLLIAAYEAQVPAEIREWAAGIPGLGDGELFARILGVLGHPRIAIPWVWEEGSSAPVPAGPPYLRDRHQQLWQYAGCGDPQTRPSVLGHRPSREELLKAGKLRSVRPLLFTFTSYLVRMHNRSETIRDSAYYQLYVQARAEAAGHEGPCGTGKWPLPCAETHRRHEHTCKNTKRPPNSPNGCGIVLHPEWGEPGSPWRPAHVNMHAHRVVQKEFLHDLWRISAR